MDPHAKAHFLVKIHFQLGIHVRHAVRNLGRRLYGIPAVLVDVACGVENRHDAVADKLVQPAAIGFNDFATDGVIFVQDVDDIKGQLVLGNLGELADIHKQNDGLLLLACQGAGAGDTGKAVLRVQQRRDRDAFRWPQLAGKAHILIDTDTLNGFHLMRIRCRQRAVAGHDPHPAGGATPFAATYRLMRDLGNPACLKDGRATGDLDGLSMRIGDCHPAEKAGAHNIADGKDDQRQQNQRIIIHRHHLDHRRHRKGFLWNCFHHQRHHVVVLMKLAVGICEKTHLFQP